MTDLNQQLKDLIENKREIEEKILSVQEKIKEELDSKEIIKRVSVNDRYFKINQYFKAVPSSDVRDDYDRLSHETLNYFHTEEEANKYADKLKLTLKVLRARDKALSHNTVTTHLKGGVNLKIDTNNKEINIYVAFNTSYPNQLFFNNMEQIELFRKMITNEEIIEFLKM